MAQPGEILQVGWYGLEHSCESWLYLISMTKLKTKKVQQLGSVVAFTCMAIFMKVREDVFVNQVP